MSCSICGKATGPGALLCRSCKGAMKRARHAMPLEIPGTPASVTMPGLLPGQYVVRVAPSVHRDTHARPLALFASGIAFAVALALAIAAYLAR